MAAIYTPRADIQCLALTVIEKFVRFQVVKNTSEDIRFNMSANPPFNPNRGFRAGSHCKYKKEFANLQIPNMLYA